MNPTIKLVAAASVLLLAAGAAMAQDKYPKKPIRMLAQGAEPVSGTPEQFLKLQRDEYARIRKLVKDIGIEPR